MLSKLSQGLATYGDRKVLAVLLLGFASGLPLLLTYSTLTAWLAQAGISRASIGLFALVGLPYSFKFLWSPLLDRLPPPLPLGRRRGWGVIIQILLAMVLLAMGQCQPPEGLPVLAALAVAVAFLSASQDIVIDAYRVELLDDDQQGPGAGATQTGYRIAMLLSGAGALFIAAHFGWAAAYGAMAAAMGVGILVFLFGPEPQPKLSAQTIEREKRAAEFLATRPHLKGVKAHILTSLYGAVVCPFVEFTTRRCWGGILVFVIGYKLGEAMAGYMAMPLYTSLGFSLDEVAAVSKVFGFFATVIGSLLGGIIIARFGAMRALLLCGILQSLGNLFYVLQASAGHSLPALALCVFAENLTGGMAGAAMVAYLSGLCNAAYTATQYALLSSLAAVGRTLFASSAGALSEQLGWISFFLFTTVVTLPALLLLLWLMRRTGEHPSPSPS